MEWFTLISPILKLVDKIIPDANKAMELKAEIQKMMIENQAEGQKTLREIAVAEISGNWFQSSWRPLLSYTSIFLLFWEFFLKGIVEAVFEVSISSGGVENIVAVSGLWLGIYGVSRTLEKTGSSIRLGKDG